MKNVLRVVLAFALCSLILSVGSIAFAVDNVDLPVVSDESPTITLVTTTTAEDGTTTDSLNPGVSGGYTKRPANRNGYLYGSNGTGLNPITITFNCETAGFYKLKVMGYALKDDRDLGTNSISVNDNNSGTFVFDNAAKGLQERYLTSSETPDVPNVVFLNEGTNTVKLEFTSTNTLYLGIRSITFEKQSIFVIDTNTPLSISTHNTGEEYLTDGTYECEIHVLSDATYTFAVSSGILSPDAELMLYLDDAEVWKLDSTNVTEDLSRVGDYELSAFRLPLTEGSHRIKLTADSAAAVKELFISSEDFVVYEMKFMNSGEDTSGEATIINFTGEEKDIKLILAGYDRDGWLVDYSQKNLLAGDGKVKKIPVEKLGDVTGVTQYSLMLWNTFEDLNSYSDALVR